MTLCSVFHYGPSGLVRPKKPVSGPIWGLKLVFGGVKWAWIAPKNKFHLEPAGLTSPLKLFPKAGLGPVLLITSAAMGARGPLKWPALPNVFKCLKLWSTETVEVTDSENRSSRESRASASSPP